MASRWCLLELGEGLAAASGEPETGCPGTTGLASYTWDSEELGDSWSLGSILGDPISYWKSKSALRVHVEDSLSPRPAERRRIPSHLKATCVASNNIGTSCMASL